MEYVVAVMGCDEFDVGGQVVGQVIDADAKLYRALGGTIYGISHLELGSIDVHFEGSSAIKRFNPVYYSGAM